MSTFFCAEESRQAGEDPIGTGDNYQIYVLIECPTPWSAQALDSRYIPDDLRALQAEIYQKKLSVRLLLIYNEQLWQENLTRVLFYRQQERLSNSYSKQEFHTTDIKTVFPAIKEYLFNGNLADENITIETRDILICTHGSHDKCCAKYGNFFYRQALATVANLSLNHVRIWQVSHFGGHRFAPTAIDFPEARYYARLDQASFISILTRTGNIQCVKHIYRGWGILPYPAQVLEREMIFTYGWDWFDYKIACQVITQSENGSFYRIEMSFEKPNGSLNSVQADVVEDESKVIYLIGECDGTEAEKTPQFSVKNIVQFNCKV